MADAAYCQRELCETIVEKEGDYLVTVKGNQPQLLRDVQQAFVIPEGGQAALFRQGVSIRREHAPKPNLLLNRLRTFKN